MPPFSSLTAAKLAQGSNFLLKLKATFTIMIPVLSDQFISVPDLKQTA
jgi:hypothetical protein